MTEEEPIYSLFAGISADDEEPKLRQFNSFGWNLNYGQVWEFLVAHKGGLFHIVAKDSEISDD